MIPTFGLILLVCTAIFFYRAADFEDLPMPLAWGGGSVVLSLTSHFAGLGLCGTIALQTLLLAAMAATIAVEKHRGTVSLGDRKSRAERKLEQGLCPKCNYDLRGTARPGNCPECGEFIPPPPEESDIIPRNEYL